MQTKLRIGNPQCGFECNRSANDHMLCIRQIHAKKWEHDEACISCLYGLQESL